MQLASKVPSQPSTPRVSFVKSKYGQTLLGPIPKDISVLTWTLKPRKSTTTFIQCKIVFVELEATPITKGHLTSLRSRRAGSWGNIISKTWQTQMSPANYHRNTTLYGPCILSQAQLKKSLTYMLTPTSVCMSLYLQFSMMICMPTTMPDGI